MKNMALDKLGELTKKIPDYNPGFFINDKLVLAQGKAIATALKKTKKVAVSFTECEEGALFEHHYHNEREVIIMVEGVLSFKDHDTEQEQILEATQAIIIDPEKLHTAKALTKCSFIAVTVPASKGFPNEQEKG